MCLLPRFAAAFAPLALFAFFAFAEPAGSRAEAPRKGAAEAVQEGNVQQWIEYYERERRKAQRPSAPEPVPVTPATDQRPPEHGRH